MSLMPILVSLCSSSWAAGTAIWLDGTPDPSLTPGLRPVLVEQALPSMRWGSDDDAAAATLAKALADSRPLLDVFDGELQILRDLEAALAAVEVIRPEDRDLVWQAELLQGLAAWRYFGDSLETEPEAAPFVARIGGKAMVSPWRDAIALDHDRVPTEADLADEIDIGLFTAKPGRGAFDSKDVLYKQRRKITSGTQKISIVTSKRPLFAGVDPYNKYIDRNSDDNIVEVTAP